MTTKVGVEGRGLPPAEWPEVEFRRAVHNYFPAMGIPILRGRGFTDQDALDPPTMIGVPALLLTIAVLACIVCLPDG